MWTIQRLCSETNDQCDQIWQNYTSFRAIFCCCCFRRKHQNVNKIESNLPIMSCWSGQSLQNEHPRLKDAKTLNFFASFTYQTCFDRTSLLLVITVGLTNQVFKIEIITKNGCMYIVKIFKIKICTKLTLVGFWLLLTKSI